MIHLINIIYVIDDQKKLLIPLRNLPDDFVYIGTLGEK